VRMLVTLTAHLRVKWPNQGAPFIWCHNLRPRSQCHIVDAETEAVPRQVMNMVNRASEAGIRSSSGIW